MIAVVLVTYQTGPILWESLDAARNMRGVTEIVVVDHGNPNDVLRQLMETEAQDPRLRVISGHGNIGFARGCNLGAKETTAPYLFMLNPDAIARSDAAEELAAAGEASEAEHWATGPRLLDPDGKEQRGSRRETLTPWSAFVEGTRLYKLMPNHPRLQRFNSHESPALDRPTPVPCLSGAAFLCPRKTWHALGGLDERYFLHVEDVDFFLRLNKAGGRAIYVPTAEVTHLKSSSQVDPLFVERRKKQSLNLYFATHFKGVYPPGFLSVLRGLLWVSFSFRALGLRRQR